jgi:formate C-acetyltransferase
MAEYRERIRSVIALGCEIVREDARVESLFGPRPWLTILSRGGLEDGRDLTAGQPKYDIIGVTLDGVADITNSLIAVRRLVFEEERVDLEGLRSALRADWEGGESLRQYVLNQLPRYGQDNEEVHAVVRAEAAFFAQCFENERTLHGDRFLPMIFGVSTSFVTDKDPKTGATPSGRRAGQPLSMSLQPSLAGRQGSVTELLRAISAIDHRDFAGGVSDVQEIDGSLFAGPDGVERLESVIRAFFFEMGGMELSLNFLDEKQLREAQKDPDRHANLMVRLFGLSARFVALSPAMQELVIQRAAAASRRQ